MTALSPLFRVATAIAGIGWLILLLLPGWDSAVPALLWIVVVLLGLIYTALLVMSFRHKRAPGSGRPGFFTLRGVQALLSHPPAAVAAWVHLLAFDLMVGLYIRSEGAELGLGHGALVPCYLLTMLFGPLGLLLFLVLVAVTG